MDLKPFELYGEISGSDQACASVLSRCLTQKGEIPYDSAYGTDAENQIDVPETKGIARIKAGIAMALDGTIPGVTLNRVSVEIVGGSHVFRVSFYYNGTEYEVAL